MTDFDREVARIHRRHFKLFLLQQAIKFVAIFCFAAAATIALRGSQ